MLRVSFVNTYDDRGGAARAAFRAFLAVSALPGVEAVFITRSKSTGHPAVLEDRSPRTLLFGEQAAAHDQRALKRLHPLRQRAPYSVNRLADTAHGVVRATRPDLVHLHWPHAGFLRIESLPLLGAPVVWTLHDMWAFTGVCHYAGDCRRYLEGCGRCPMLASDDPADVSARVFARKRAAYARTRLHLAAPSKWLADLASRSPLLAGLPVDVTPNGLDTGAFAPLDRAAARAALGLPGEGRLLLMGADHALNDPRKGCAALLEALAQGGPAGGSGSRPGAGFRPVVFGNAPADDRQLRAAERCGAILLGPLRGDEALARAYSACDLYAFPSAQDNLPNTVMEALSCGLPVLALDIGGLRELVRHGQTGMLAEVSEATGASACGMHSFLQALQDFPVHRLDEMGRAARADALARFSLEALGRRHQTLYSAALERFGNAGRLPGDPT